VTRAAPAEAHVAVLGASPKTHRYSYQAVTLLRDHGYRVTPIHPRAPSVAEVPAVPHMDQIAAPVHTLTLYVGPSHLRPLTDALIRLAPARVIFNPGSESAEVQRRLNGAGIHWIEACTLVMLRTGNF